MLIAKPDFARRIDLPGAGPCPRPVDVDRARTGFAQLVALRVYSFPAGVAIDGEAEADEVFVTLVRGEAAMAVTHAGRQVAVFTLRASGGDRVVYLPPHAGYRLTARTACDVAYARAVPAAAVPPPRAFAGDAARLAIAGYATGMDLTLATYGAGDGPAPAGAAAERLVHVRMAPGAAAVLDGARLDDWDAAALAPGEDGTIMVEAGAVEILAVTAAAG